MTLLDGEPSADVGSKAASGRRGRAEPLSWPGGVASAATVGLAVVQVLLTGTILPFDFPRMPAVRLSLCAVVLLAVAASVNALANAYAARGRTSWWDAADQPDGELTWSEVYGLVYSDRALDPLAAVSSNRAKARPAELFWLAGTSFAVAAVSSQVLVFLWDPMTPWWLLRDGSDIGFTSLVSVSNNLTAYLALLTSVVAIIFTRRDGRWWFRSRAKSAARPAHCTSG